VRSSLSKPLNSRQQPKAGQSKARVPRTHCILGFTWPLPRIRSTVQSLNRREPPNFLTHRRRSPPTSNPPPHLAESEVPTIENRHMPELPLSSSRKRRRLEPPQQNETSRPVSKKQRLSGSHPPPAFWDNLSKIWLTKRALRELDRRNAQAAPSPPRSPHQRTRRPVPRNFVVESERNRQTTQYTADYLRYEPRILKDIKLFARHGGPDLSDLRNVRIIRYLPACAKANDAL
jgi:hypothetical protein